MVERSTGASFKVFNPPSPSGLPAGSSEALTGVYAASLRPERDSNARPTA